MPDQPRSALVLQGGGALGAYELGAARALYEDDQFAPDIIAGVSIGAITAALLARPADGLNPVQALNAFWQKVAVPGSGYPPPLAHYASVFGNPNFFVPRFDYGTLPTWTYFYDTRPLRHTLSQLIDLNALADPARVPRLLVSATDVEQGQIKYFYSGENGLTLDHILASGSLPPAFSMTTIDSKSYWDGGLFDNTPLGAVLDRLDTTTSEAPIIYVVNLFSNKASIPQNMLQVAERVQNLLFANKSLEDLKMLRRINEVAALMEALESVPEANPLKDNLAYKAVKARRYVRVQQIISITRSEQAGSLDSSDFSPATIEKRASEGYAQAKRALKDIG